MRNYRNCLHRNAAGRCQLYIDGRRCDQVNRRDLKSCVFIDKSKFDWKNPTCHDWVRSSLEYFIGETLPRDMELAGKPLKVDIRNKKKVLGFNPLVGK